MWRLSKLAVNNRILAIIITVIIAVVSILSFSGLKQELIPDIDFPFTTVVTIYPNATPEMVVQNVTSPIEDLIWSKWGDGQLKHVTSNSSEGISIIFAEFEFGTNMEDISASIRNEVSTLPLPQEVTSLPQMSPSVSSNPQVVPINLSMLPVNILSVSGDFSAVELRKIVEEHLAPSLNTVDGILNISIDGGASDQLVITPDVSKMVANGISVSQILAFMPTLTGSPEEIAATPITEDVVLGDVARFSLSPSPMSVITRFNGNSSIGISILKKDSANTIEVSKALSDAIAEALPSLPEGVKVSTVFNQADFIEYSISELWSKAIIGGLLAVAVVFIFLMIFRASLLTAISVPLSVFFGFLCMYLSGITINILTLSGMSIAIGRLIDDSIVLVEVIYRRRQLGDNFKDAAITGAKEVATPITAATLATVVIFIPLMFVGGLVGELFIPFGLTITFALLGSLLVALIVVPALSKHLLSPRKSKSDNKDKTNWYQKLYTKGLKWSLKHRATVLIVTAVLFVGTLCLIPVVGTSFIPEMGEKMISINVQLPAEAQLADTSNVAKKIEAILSEMDSVQRYFTTIGTSGSLSGVMSSITGGGSNTASINAYLDKNADVAAEVDSLKEKTADLLEFGYIDISGEGALGGFTSSSVSLSVQGKDRGNVTLVTLELMKELEEVEGLINVGANVTKTITRLNVEINPQKVLSAGLTQEQLGLVQQEYMLLVTGGTIPGKTINVEGQSYPIYVSAINTDTIGIEEAEKFKLGFPVAMEIGQIADISYLEMPSHIGRTDLSFSTTVTGTITSQNIGKVNSIIQQKIDSLPDHPGVEIKTAGIAEEMKDSFNRMGIALIAAIFLVFLVMIAFMQSIKNPLIILASLPLASIGALLGLFLTGHTISLFAMLGILMLVGLVLTNAIVLLSMVEDLRRENVPVNEAILTSGEARVRPILMTALTTIVAMLPLAIGIDSGLMATAELAIVVICGLVSSTFLTLFVIPVIYSSVNRDKPKKIEQP
jgi:HAE1 family hydrophobic/amphiphilic exporter-1